MLPNANGRMSSDTRPFLYSVDFFIHRSKFLREGKVGVIMAEIPFFKVESLRNLLEKVAKLVIFVIFLFIAIKYLRAIKSRKRFIRDLKRFAEENQYILSEIYYPVASIFRHYDGYSFLLKKDNREFTCRLLATVNKRTPVVFTSAESGYYRHRIGGKKHHITIQHKFDYGFDKGEYLRRALGFLNISRMFYKS